MPNANVPSGLSPVRGVNSQPYNGGVNAYSVPASDATALYVGDPVKLVGTSQTINGTVYADVAQAATGDVIVGVIVAVQPNSFESPTYRPASSQRVVLVHDDPNALFEIQDISTGTPLTIADIGLNVNFTYGAGGSTATGLSGAVVDNTTEATTNTLALKIVGFVNRPDNDAANAEASKKLQVRINRHQYVNQVAGV